jgi:hypothetical protein
MANGFRNDSALNFEGDIASCFLGVILPGNTVLVDGKMGGGGSLELEVSGFGGER